MSASAPPLFSARLIAGWLAAAALTFAASFYFMTRDNSAPHRLDDVAPSIYSKSALGYAALYHALPALGIPAGVNTAATGSPLGAAVVVIAEPDRDEQTLAHVRAVLRDARAVLLVLPKRRGTADPNRLDWLAKDALLPLGETRRVLALVDDGATVERSGYAATWAARPPFTGVPSLHQPQLMHSDSVAPLLASRNGILAGGVRGGAAHVVVLADPDLLDNHGITRGDNARLAVALLRELRGASGERVVFDEVVHGYVSRPFSALRLLFVFPFVLVTAQLALAAVLLVWSAVGRFGMPKPREPALPLGKQSLIDTGSRLLERAGALRFLADRYADAVLRETARALNAPRGLSSSQLSEWLARAGRPAPPSGDAPPAGAAAAVAEARAVYTWRRDALDESGRRTQHRRRAED